MTGKRRSVSNRKPSIRNTLGEKRHEMRHAFNERTIGALKGFGRKPYKTRDLAMLPRTAQPVAHQPPVTPAARS